VPSSYCREGLTHVEYEKLCGEVDVAEEEKNSKNKENKSDKKE
jgi:hypothetical protein